MGFIKILKTILSKYLRQGWAVLTNFLTFNFIKKVKISYTLKYRITSIGENISPILYFPKNFLKQIKNNENKSILKVSIWKVIFDESAFLMPVHHNEIFTNFLINSAVWSNKVCNNWQTFWQFLETCGNFQLFSL